MADDLPVHDQVVAVSPPGSPVRKLSHGRGVSLTTGAVADPHLPSSLPQPAPSDSARAWDTYICCGYQVEGAAAAPWLLCALLAVGPSTMKIVQVSVRLTKSAHKHLGRGWGRKAPCSPSGVRFLWRTEAEECVIRGRGAIAAEIQKQAPNQHFRQHQSQVAFGRG